MPEQQLNAKIPRNPEFTGFTMNANRDYPFYDYKEALLSTDWQTYVVGTNQVNAHGDQRKLFVSKSTLLFSDVYVYVRFNNSKNVPIPLLPNTWYEFKSNITSVDYYYMTTGEKYLAMIFEGTLSEEARSPE